MKSLQNLKNILEQLKDNSKTYNLNEQDILKIDQALEEIEKLENEDRTLNRVEKSVTIGVKIASIVEKIFELFKDSS